jgi:hypothetical protein
MIHILCNKFYIVATYIVYSSYLCIKFVTIYVDSSTIHGHSLMLISFSLMSYGFHFSVTLLD